MAVLLIAVSAISLFTVSVLSASKNKMRGDGFLKVYFITASFLYFILYVQFVTDNDFLSLFLLLVNQITAPLLFFYSEKLMFKGKSSLISRMILIIPFAYSLTVLISLLLLLPEKQLNLLFHQWPMTPNLPLQIVYLLEMLILPIAILYLLKKHGEYGKRLRDKFSSLERIELRWVRSFYIVELASWFLSTILFLIFSEQMFYGLLAAGSALVYLAFLRLILDPLRNPMPQEKKARQAYERSGASPEDLISYLERLDKLMNEKRLFLESKLTLSELSGYSHVSEHNISRALNQGAETSFFAYINGFRVEEVLRRIGQGDLEKQTLLSIALESGFNSKSTFNRVFRELKGMTPSEAGKKVSTSRMGR